MTQDPEDQGGNARQQDLDAKQLDLDAKQLAADAKRVDLDARCVATTEQLLEAADRLVAELFPELTDPILKPTQQRFLTAYMQCGQVKRASREAHVDHRSHYVWLQNDPNYRAAYDRARIAAGDVAEDEAFRRAVQGWEEPVFYQGTEVGTVTRYDGMLLARILAAFKSGYRTQQVNIVPDLSKLTDEEVLKLHEAVSRIARAGG